MPNDTDLPALTFNPDRMRKLGYRIIDMIVDHHQQIASKPAATHADRKHLHTLLHEAPPDLPSDPEAVLDTIERDLLSCMTFSNHPRFFAYIPGPGNYIGALGDALASGFNIINTLWLEASAPAQIELTAIDWLRQWCGLPDSAGGLFVSGGSVANLTGLAVARQIKLGNQTNKALVYCSDQTHGSLQKNLKLLGFHPEQFIKIAADNRYRLDTGRLVQQIKLDMAAGKTPFCVIANAGTTNTGAVDPLPEITRLCRHYDMWLHVDGAYGAPAILCSRGKQLLQGLEMADSITVDPHKWLFQPFEIGCTLVRNARWLPLTFGQQHEYMQDAMVDTSQTEVNFCDYGIQLSRGFRALKFWMTVKTFGVEAIRSAIERSMELAEYAQYRLERQACFEITSAAQLGIVSFRYNPGRGSGQDIDAVNLAIVKAILDNGFAMISSTQLNGRTCLRLCTINPRTKHDDIDQTVDMIAAMGEKAAKMPPQ